MNNAILKAALALSVLTSPAFSQAKYPAWPYAASYDSATAASANNKLLFEDNKMRLFEVLIRPGEHEPMSGQPYPAVYFHDSPMPDASHIVDVPLDRASTLNGQGAGHGTAPPGAKYMTCDTTAPRAPHEVTNNGNYPIHYYRLEFKRVDGADLAAHWKEWYPWMLGPIPDFANVDPSEGHPFSKEFAYPISLDPVAAAPNNHRALYTDSHVRLVEVTERPESQENLHGHPYYSIFINDVVVDAQPTSVPKGLAPPAAQDSSPLGKPGPYHKGEVGDYQLDPKAAPMQRGKPGLPPAGMIAMSCSAATPQAPHAHINGGQTPFHFYRFEYLRLDGDDFKTHWKQWYP